MAKIFSGIPPILCKSSRVRKWGQSLMAMLFVHDQITDENHLCFNLVIYMYIQIKGIVFFFFFFFFFFSFFFEQQKKKNRHTPVSPSFFSV